jgi:hypothetical protein
MLSKTQFMNGCQCRLRLWYEVHRPELATPADPPTAFALRQGQAIHELARRRVPLGRRVPPDSRTSRRAVQETRRLIQDPEVPGIFEAAFQFKGVLVRTDLLERGQDGTWRLLEVKGSVHSKPHHDLDLALQAWVLQGAGLGLGQAGLLTLDPAYRYDGVALDPMALFRSQDCTEAVARRGHEIGLRVAAQIELVASPEPPAVAPGRHCFEPHPCPFYGHCTRGQVPPAHPLAELPHLRQARLRELEAGGFNSISELPEGTPLTGLQARVRACVLAGRPWRSPGLGPALAALEAPCHYLDFETYAPALPEYRGMGPFQRVPFQWSCHHQDPDGALRHTEFLPLDGADPREAFARTLLATLGTRGSICVYSGFEEAVIRELAAQLPHLARRLLALRARLVDLLQLIRTHYYHPDFHGSFSIKRVLPVLAPGLDYGALAIHRGDQASLAFQELVASPDPEIRARLRRDLLAYCCLDTLAMVRITQALAAAV